MNVINPDFYCEDDFDFSRYLCTKLVFFNVIYLFCFSSRCPCIPPREHTERRVKPVAGHRCRRRKLVHMCAQRGRC